MKFKIVLLFLISFLLNTSVYANDTDALFIQKWGVKEQYSVAVGYHEDQNIQGIKEYYLSTKKTDQDRRTYMFENGADGPFSIDYHGYEFEFKKDNVLLIGKKDSSEKTNEAWSYSSTTNVFKMNEGEFELVLLNNRKFVLGLRTRKFGLALYEYLVLEPFESLIIK